MCFCQEWGDDAWDESVCRYKCFGCMLGCVCPAWVLVLAMRKITGAGCACDYMQGG